jgi:hypothetical protein
MKSVRLTVLLLCVLTFQSCKVQPKLQNLHQEEISINIDWKNYLGEQDMIWKRLPQTWDEAPFLGNGTLGLMVYKPQKENSIHLDIGNSYVQDHRDDSYGNILYSRPRLPVGFFRIKPSGNILDGEMRLNLWNAETTGTITTDKGTLDLLAYVHAEKMVIIVEVTPTEGEKDFEIEWQPAEAISPRQSFAIKNNIKGKVMEDYKKNPPSTLTKKNNISLSTQALLTGGETATAWQEKVIGQKRIMASTISHSWPQKTASDEAVGIIADVMDSDFHHLRKEHASWWNNFYPRSFISLPNKKLENFYWIQLYKLGSATRSDGALIDNQGPWLQETPWPSAFWNLNVQLTYWPVYASNHLDLGESLLHTLINNQENLIENVPEEYRDNSAGIGRATTQNLISPIDRAWTENKPTHTNISTKVPEIGLLTWACHNLWLQYKYSMDDKMLRNKLFPLLRKSINYYLHFIERKENGELHLQYTYSPEYGISRDTNFDLALLKWGCNALIESCERLGIKDALLPVWKGIVENLTDFPKDENGFRIGKDLAYEKSHRHYSHLMMIYPLYLVNKEQDGGKELIEESLKHWHSMPEALAGYSFTGASSISAAIGNGDKALQYLKGLFSDFLRPNTMYKEAGPVIETPLSGAQSILDMLIQSWGGKIRVFPALPTNWKNVSFHKLRTEGAFLVSASMKNGEIQFIQLHSLMGEPCILKFTMNHPPQIISERDLNYEWLKEDELRIDLNKGEKAIIYPQHGAVHLVIEPKPKENDSNTKPFGLPDL